MAEPRSPQPVTSTRQSVPAQRTDAQRLELLCARRDHALRDPLKAGEAPAGNGEPASTAADTTMLDRWRAADHAARVQETIVVEGSLRALDGRGACPSVQDRARARALRQTADDLFALATADLKARAAALRPAAATSQSYFLSP